MMAKIFVPENEARNDGDVKIEIERTDVNVSTRGPRNRRGAALALTGGPC